MYHMDEDRQLEAAMDHADIEHEEHAAEYLSQNSYADAINDYRDLAADGTIFEEAFRSGQSWGERLTERLQLDIQKLNFGIVRYQLLNETEQAVLFDALVLPFNIRYFEYTYVGSGGNSRLENGEADKFDEEERWESCEETDIRDALVDVLYEYCATAAALAKRLGARREQLGFLKALQLIEGYCRNGCESDLGGMGKTDAGRVCKWVMDGTLGLWAYSTAEARLKKWERQDKGIELTPEQKRYDELLKKSIAGLITPEEEQELFALASHSHEKIEGAIKPSSYYKPFVKVNNKQRRITILPEDEQPITYTIPDGYENAWNILKLILESPDEKEGWYQFTQPHQALGQSWRQQFYHNTKPILAMKDLLRFFYSRKTRGQRGLPCIRIERKQKPVPDKTKRKSKRPSTNI